MDRTAVLQSELAYVMGCLCFCAETLAQLGQRELAEDVAEACAALKPALSQGQVASGGSLH